MMPIVVGDASEVDEPRDGGGVARGRNAVWVSFKLEKPESAAYVAGEGSGDLPSDPGSSSSPSTPLRSTAFTATIMEETDIKRAENSGLSMMP